MPARSEDPHVDLGWAVKASSGIPDTRPQAEARYTSAWHQAVAVRLGKAQSVTSHE